MRALTQRDALRAAKTHPIKPDMLGARVVAVLGSLIGGVAGPGHQLSRAAARLPVVESRGVKAGKLLGTRRGSVRGRCLGWVGWMWSAGEA